MRPKSQQIVRSILSEVTQASQYPERVDIPNVLAGIKVGLNEVLLRDDVLFYEAFVEQGRHLSEEAYQVLRGSMPDGCLASADIDTILEVNANLTLELLNSSEQRAVELADRIVEWELGFYAKRLEDACPDSASHSSMSRLTAENFQVYLRAKKRDWPNVKVTSFKLQPGGYSKITVLVDLEDDKNGQHSVVIRAQPDRCMLDLDGMAIASEYPVVRYAYEAGLPAPEPLLLETDTSHIGYAFMLSKKVPGKTLGSFTGADSEINETMIRSILGLIAEIANTPIDRDSELITQSHIGRWLGFDSMQENTREFITYWRGVGVRGHSLPSGLLNYAVNWLLKNVPEEEARPNLIHGDIGFHNVLFHDGKIAALLDWENSRFGDTAEELSMFVSSIAHLYDHGTILGWYHEAGGPPVSEWRLRYFDVYMAMKIIVSAQVSLQRVEENPDGNLRLAVFGLRYLHMVGSRLMDLIHLADTAKKKKQPGS